MGWEDRDRARKFVVGKWQLVICNLMKGLARAPSAITEKRSTRKVQPSRSGLGRFTAGRTQPKAEALGYCRVLPPESRMGGSEIRTRWEPQPIHKTVQVGG